MGRQFLCKKDIFPNDLRTDLSTLLSLKLVRYGVRGWLLLRTFFSRIRQGGGIMFVLEGRGRVFLPTFAWRLTACFAWSDLLCLVRPADLRLLPLSPTPNPQDDPKVRKAQELVRKLLLHGHHKHGVGGNGSKRGISLKAGSVWKRKQGKRLAAAAAKVRAAKAEVKGTEKKQKKGEAEKGLAAKKKARKEEKAEEGASDGGAAAAGPSTKKAAEVAKGSAVAKGAKAAAAAAAKAGVGKPKAQGGKAKGGKAKGEGGASAKPGAKRKRAHRSEEDNTSSGAAEEVEDAVVAAVGGEEDAEEGGASAQELQEMAQLRAKEGNFVMEVGAGTGLLGLLAVTRGDLLAFAWAPWPCPAWASADLPAKRHA